MTYPSFLLNSYSFHIKDFYFFIADQCVESSLQVKMSSSARTVSIKQEPEDHLKQEPEDHIDLSKFQAHYNLLFRPLFVQSNLK